MQVAIIALGLAFLMDVLVGDPPNRIHPVVAMGHFIRFAQRKLNHGSVQNRFINGLLTIMIGGVLFSLPWLIILLWIEKLPVWAAGLLMALLLKPVFSFRNLIKAGKEVQQSLKTDNLSEARRLVAWHLVSRDTSQLSKKQVASAVIESLAENITDSFFAPLLFFAIGGLPAAWFYRFVNTADSMIAYHTPELEVFGKTAARLDDLFNWLPARLAALVLVVSAGLAGLNMTSAWRTMKTQNCRTSSPNAGWTMSAAAGALEVILEKPDNYRLEGGTDLPDETKITQSLKLVIISMLVCLIFCGGTLLVIQTLA